MDYILVFIMLCLGMYSLYLAITSILNTRKEAVNDFLQRHESVLKKHNHYPKD